MVGVLALCGSVVSLMQTLVVPLLPSSRGCFGASAVDTSWLVTATLVAGAVCAADAGRLGDMYGKRRMLSSRSALMARFGARRACPHVGTLIVVAGRCRGSRSAWSRWGSASCATTLPGAGSARRWR